ncbi:MAG: hypothetical protein K6A94_00785 [Bacteroidales bacterium]|nr:hypothetical protein [Bacteroidales bacterium]
MRKFIFIIILYFLSCFLAGCRAKLDTNSSTLRRQTDEIGVELRRIDSLWRSSSERLTYKIEFYEPNMDCFVPRNDAKRQNNEDLDSLCYLRGSKEAAPCFAVPATVLGGIPLTGSAGGGMGAVKSIEISTEKEEAVSSITAADSTYYNHTDDQETREANTTTEARQDNGTVAVVAIVAAVAGLIYLMFNASRKS